MSNQDVIAVAQAQANLNAANAKVEADNAAFSAKTYPASYGTGTTTNADGSFYANGTAVSTQPYPINDPRLLGGPHQSSRASGPNSMFPGHVPNDSEFGYDFARFGYPYPLGDHEARLAALEAAAGIARPFQPKPFPVSPVPAYDANGNLISFPVSTPAYDANGNVIR